MHASKDALISVSKVEDVYPASKSNPLPRSKGWRFWTIFLSLCLATFLSALELSAVSTALPAIVHDLRGGDFVWVGAAYALASTAFLPMSGGVAEVRIASYFPGDHVSWLAIDLVDRGKRQVDFGSNYESESRRRDH